MLGEGTLGYKVMLITYRVCLEKAPGSQSNAVIIQDVLGEGTLSYKVMLKIYRVCLEKASWFPGLESCWSW